MRFSNDSTNWSAPEPYFNAKAWLLSSGDGAKRVFVTYKDAAGNWSGPDSDAIVLDTRAPVIISVWPALGSFVAGGNPITLNIVFGDAASGIDVQKVKLFDESGNDTTSQAQIQENNIQFLIRSPVDKRYTYTLYLEDKAGNKTSQEFTFTVDSTVPEVWADVMGGSFQEPLVVKIQCSENASIYYSTDGYPPFEGAANTTLMKGTFAPVQIDKTTKLQFFAVDEAGNRSKLKTEIYLFNELPAPITALQGFYNESAKRVELQWPSASPVSGYYVYRVLNIQEINLLKESNIRKYPAPARLRISGGLLASNIFYDNDVLSGTTYWYGVSLVDNNGLESPVSELVSVKIPEQPPAIDAGEAARRALAWIEAHQKEQGYWGEKKELYMLGTSQILNALKLTNSDNLWARQALFYLRGRLADNNDYLARKIITLSKFGQNVDEEANRLLSESDLTGSDIYGWGVRKYYGNDAMTTVLGVQALRAANFFVAGAGAQDKTFEGLLNYPYDYNPGGLDETTYFRALRSKDGRYGWVPKDDTSIFVSSLVYFTLELDSSFYRWILDTQKPDGSFDKGLIDTAAVLLWIPLEEPAKTKAINHLVSQQRPDGSWNTHDAYVTGLCLEALLKNTR